MSDDTTSPHPTPSGTPPTGAPGPAAVELGLDTFGDVTAGPDGTLVSGARTIRDVVEEAELADQVGVDFFGVGEHHRADFAVSAPEVVLAGIATRTSRIRLGSAVTVLSSDDPVRVFERFSTLDALSGGRAEVILGRGSFIESFPLFGYDLADYEVLFEEKLDLFVRLLDEGPVTWSGTTRPGLTDQEVWPKTEGGRLRTWVGVGGSPESVVRTARHGLGLMLAIIGGEPERFRPYVDLYHRAVEEFGNPALPVGVHSPGHVAETDEQAQEEVYEHFAAMNNRIGRERGWPAYHRGRFAHDVRDGSLYVGSPETVARKIARTVRLLGAGRFDLKYSAGTLPHAAMLRSIELYGTQVVPRVRELLAEG
ncbi:LLM class flavin-dependent oxidoreductase [Cellulosimicrobium composti]|uniref:LLM class flavin-dependent oxidoreductase n=1 Tax=Cellulosimicrobium composti TaxID=2672572 RepID=A0A6N7ZHE0_9MICO|nr:LLM class flavin-dependent oxidoreductase [Cellulosimicrobium composti]MTG88836.1 LLM class flavin-dependent oxidoreductase [Cellulosimicrobium composti]